MKRQRVFVAWYWKPVDWWWGFERPDHGGLGAEKWRLDIGPLEIIWYG